MNKNLKNDHKASFDCDNYLIDNGYGLYIEEYFQKMLAQERKRTDRSNDPFLLVLIDIGPVYRDNKESSLIGNISKVLYSCTRDIDIKGWFKQGAVIGIICTEIGGYDIDVFIRRIKESLPGSLEVDGANKVTVTFHIYPEDYGRDGKNSEQPDESFYPDLRKIDKADKKNRAIKRAIDIIGSLFCILLFSPLFLAIPILIKLTSPGPVIFRQERMGRFGKRFQFMKFRSMYVQNDDSIHKRYVENLIKKDGNGSKKGNGNGDGENVFKIKNDPRITRIGWILRKSSMDELPQFFNVLKGEMSLVGPRPPIPYELENYELWHRKRILEVKPGITGIWQVYGRSQTTFDEMVRMDLEYVRKWTPGLDIRLLLKTPFAVISGKGAY